MFPCIDPSVDLSTRRSIGPFMYRPTWHREVQEMSALRRDTPLRSIYTANDSSIKTLTIKFNVLDTTIDSHQIIIYSTDSVHTI